jgi:rhodanese-related sulfurtransferase
VVYCAAGMRSYGVTHWLREQGWTDAWSLSSGLHGAVEAGFEIVRPE